MLLRTLAALGLLCVFFVAHAVKADPITLFFEGTIDWVKIDEWKTLASQGVGLGSRVSGHIQYQSETPSFEKDGDRVYFPGDDTSIGLQAGPVGFLPGPGIGISVLNDGSGSGSGPHDVIHFSGGESRTEGTSIVPNLIVEITFADDQGLALDSTDLPLSGFPDVSLWSTASFRACFYCWTFEDPLHPDAPSDPNYSGHLAGYEIHGTIDSIRVVPEPATWLLVILAGMGLFVRRIRSE